jgi:hypothetical protein
MKTVTNQNIDPAQWILEKYMDRERDLRDLIDKKKSRTDLQKQNSMFVGIDWSKVEIFEPDGYHWQPDTF